MKTILIIAYSALVRDPRVMRQIFFLRQNYNIITCGLEDPQVDGVTFIQIEKNKKGVKNKLLTLLRLGFGFFEKHYWAYAHNISSFEQLNMLKYDLIIANDIHTLPLAVKIARGRGVILDAHEYAPLEFEDILIWRIISKRYIHYLCKTYLPKASKMLTVSRGIAEKYKEVYNVEADIITNAPFFCNIKIKKTAPDRVRLIHHGIAHPSREIEKMIYLVDYLDQRFELDLMLVESGFPNYMNTLHEIVSQRDRVRIVAPVKLDQIIERLSDYDVGLFMLKPVNYNYEMALPNKLFEFIQARLAVAVGPSPEMKRVVEKYDCGVIANDFSTNAMVEKLLELDAETINYYKTRADIAAKDLTAENNRDNFLRVVEEAIS